MDNTTETVEGKGHGLAYLDRYHAISYMNGDDRVTVIQDFENDDAWIQSDLAIEPRN